MILNRDMQRNNNTRHFQATASTGEALDEKCRDSLGGWANMAKRVAEHFGGTDLRSADEDGTVWNVVGTETTVTFEEWSTL